MKAHAKYGNQCNDVVSSYRDSANNNNSTGVGCAHISYVINAKGKVNQ